MRPQYPIRAVSKLTGIPADTLRAWERRYGAVEPDRSERVRLYSETDVRHLALLRGAVEAGHSIGRVASKSDSELEGLSRLLPARGAVPSVRAHAGSSELGPLLEAIGAFDPEAVNEELGRLAILMGPADLVHRVVLPVMRLAGDGWREGSLQIAQVHLFCACVRNLLGGLVRLQRPADQAPRILFTTLSGELHEFGILAGAMLAVARQFRVTYLGPDLPAREILGAARACVPRAVVVGILAVNAGAAARADVSRLAAELPPSTELWLAGSGAEAVAGARRRPAAFVIGDFAEFERHLVRLKAGEAVR